MGPRPRDAWPPGEAEREAARTLVRRLQPGAAPGADKRSRPCDLVAVLRAQGITPHVAQVSGWLKIIVLLRKTRYRSVCRVGWMFTFAAGVYNLVRIRNLGWGEAST